MIYIFTIPANSSTLTFYLDQGVCYSTVALLELTGKFDTNRPNFIDVRTNFSHGMRLGNDGDQRLARIFNTSTIAQTLHYEPAYPKWVKAEQTQVLRIWLADEDGDAILSTEDIEIMLEFK